MHAVIVLLEDEPVAVRAAEVIADVTRGRTVVLVPPVRGTAFFADTGVAEEVDRWWGESVPHDALPLYVMDFAPGVVPWLDGIDGLFLMLGMPENLESCAGDRVRPVRGSAILELAWRVLDEVAPGGGDDDSAGAPPPRVTAADDPSRGAGPAPPVHPFELLAATPSPQPATSPPSPGASPGMVRRRWNRMSGTPMTGEPRRALPAVLSFPRWRPLRANGVDAHAGDIELAGALARRGSTVVAVGSRKGGVGKTSHAAGMAILAGSVLDAIGHRAGIVDSNLANPDAWGVLNLPPGAATVRDTIAALDANLDPPRPVHATTPALACYPESRQASEYSRHDIDLFAAHLRRGYALAVIDLGNRLPDPTGGPEAAAAAFWLDHADVVVLPTAWAKQDFNGVLDFLELEELPPAVVAYIAPRSRRHRAHPLTQRYLDAIAQRATRMVELPDEADNVRYAGMAGVPIDSVSRSLRAGYRALLAAVIDAAGPGTP